MFGRFQLAAEFDAAIFRALAPFRRCVRSAVRRAPRCGELVREIVNYE